MERSLFTVSGFKVRSRESKLGVSAGELWSSGVGQRNDHLPEWQTNCWRVYSEQPLQPVHGNGDSQAAALYHIVAEVGRKSAGCHGNGSC
jgi:hypothetical protein